MKRPPGFAYLFAVLVTALLVGAVLVTLDESSLELAMAHNRVDAVRSEWLARGAVQQVAWRMRYDPAFRTAVSLGPIANVAIDPQLGGGPYSYDISRNGFNWLITGTGGTGGTGFVTHQLLPDSILTAQIVCPCIADVLIAEANPNANYGASSNLSVKVAVGGRQRLLLRFSLAGVPAGTAVQSAFLEMWLRSTAGDENVRLQVHEVTVPWDEGTGTGAGAPDGATWNNATTTSVWKFPGVDGNYSSSRGDIQPAGPGIYRWDITSTVQNWVQGRLANNGLFIRARSEVDMLPLPDDRTFSAREDEGGIRKPVIYIYTGIVSGSN
jgi:hypothetical protein